MRNHLLLFLLAVLFLQCNTSPYSEETPKQENTTTEGTKKTAVSESLSRSIQQYFEENDHCTILSKDPLTLKASVQDTGPTFSCENAETQLEINLCAAADVCLEIQTMRQKVAQITADDTKVHEPFLQDVWTFLQQVEEEAKTAGQDYEGGSMQPLFILHRKTPL